MNKYFPKEEQIELKNYIIKKFNIDINNEQLPFILRNIIFQYIYPNHENIDNIEQIKINYNNFKKYIENTILHYFKLLFDNKVKENYCQPNQIMYLQLLKVFNIKARPVAFISVDENTLSFSSHASVEIFHKNCWIISDPRFNVCIKNYKNKLIGTKDLHIGMVNHNKFTTTTNGFSNKNAYGIFPSDYSLTTYKGLLQNIILKDKYYVTQDIKYIKKWIDYYQNIIYNNKLYTDLL